jgi:hypothetical protein
LRQEWKTPACFCVPAFVMILERIIFSILQGN